MRKIFSDILALVVILGIVGCAAPTQAPTVAPAATLPAATKPAATQPAATQPPAATTAPAASVIDGKGMKVGLSMDSLESAFWIANEKAIKAQAVTDNVQLIEVIAEGDANKQNQQIENLIAQGVKAIIIAPKDGSAIEAAVQKAKDANI